MTALNSPLASLKIDVIHRGQAAEALGQSPSFQADSTLDYLLSLAASAP